MDTKHLEKYSSAISLSDMEIFVFPELMYSLVLANIMSPVLWKWRERDTFKKLEGKSSWRRLLRMRQFIMDEYEFNLDLNTWGMSDKDTELKRFAPFISPDDISKSNALFGYHGDEYYFDIGIRRHFGLDKYQGDAIPYWKTETLEAMDAFKYKQGYTTGAGECVSLAALYIAAAFVVCDIELKDMYMILTPLHSQNFVDMQDGAITNNRRVVTKGMWFNGTAITDKAQRAMRNESVTVVSHSSGYIHCYYDDATIDPNTYEKFAKRLDGFLTVNLDMATFANFLRSKHEYQNEFVFCRHHRGEDKFVRAEILFQYEHGNPMRIGGDSLDKMFNEVSEEDFHPFKPDERICVEQLIRFMKKSGIDIFTQEGRKLCTAYFDKNMDDSEKFVADLCEFCKIDASLPSPEKKYISGQNIEIEAGMSRAEIFDYLKSKRQENLTIDLAFYSYRDMELCDWQPFVKASIERCPVSIEACAGFDNEQVYQWLKKMDNDSIYEDSRLAHPDEVANFSRGDGLEKAITMANVLLARNPELEITITVDKDIVVLLAQDEYEFISKKSLRKSLRISKDACIVSDLPK